jgi:hypothetical protein
MRSHDRAPHRTSHSRLARSDRDPKCSDRDPQCGDRDPQCGDRDPQCGDRDPQCSDRKTVPLPPSDRAAHRLDDTSQR